MLSERSQVLETRILENRELTGPGGRRYQEIRIEYPDRPFLPGQFVMVRKALGPTCWAYPYMLQEKDENGITVYAVQGSSLYQGERGLPLLVWGANGRGIETDQHTVVISQTETAFFATPFLNMGKEIRHIWIGGQGGEGFLKEKAQTRSADSAEKAAALVQAMLETAGSRPKQLIFALNITESQRLLELIKGNGGSDLSKLPDIQILAPTRINCGVGGCKGCYLHSKELKLGIPVCCSGPFLSSERIDFEADKRCFQVFE